MQRPGAVQPGQQQVQRLRQRAALLIGCTTFTLSAIGVKVGAAFGDKYRTVSERIGGLVLILIGLKTLIQSFL